MPHRLAVTRDEVILARCEQSVLVLPRRRDQRNAAGQRLEHADRRNPRQRLGIGPPRDVHGHMRRGESKGSAKIRQVAGEVDAGVGEHRLPLRRITHPVDPRRQPHRFDRPNQKFAELDGALLIAPIADPHEVALLADLGVGTKQGQIGRLVPGEDLPAPAMPPIGVAQHIAKGEHPVETVEIESGNRLPVSHHPMMRIVEQQQIPPTAATMRGDALDQGRLVPFMHQHDIGAVERPIQIEPCGVVDGDRQIGIGLAPRFERRLALLGNQIAGAPPIRRLERPDRDAAALTFAEHAAQEMRVAVVPVGSQRMAKQHEFRHHATSRCAGSATISRYSAA